jgi:hypothetical protein
MTQSGHCPGAKLTGTFNIFLNNSSSAVFPDALVPPSALSLASFDSTSFRIDCRHVENSRSDVIVGGHLETVPLPAALPLFATGSARLAQEAEGASGRVIDHT